MELQVITPDGRRGTLVGSLLDASAWKQVEVRLPEGSAFCYLRELRLDDSVQATEKSLPEG
jgi:hypothetical protein